MRRGVGGGEGARGFPAPGGRGRGSGSGSGREFRRRYFTGGDVAKNELLVWVGAE